MNRKILKTIGERIQDIREYEGISQTEMADLLGLKTKQSILNYEKGYRFPDANVLTSIVKIFKVNANWLLTGEGKRFKGIKDETITDEDIITRLIPGIDPKNLPIAMDIIKKMSDKDFLYCMNDFLSIINEKANQRKKELERLSSLLNINANNNS